MADITRFRFVSHLRANPTTHVRHLRNGKLAHEGPGQAFWFRALNSSLSEVPIDDREQPLLFHGRTADFQDVAVQASVTYRVTDPELAASRLDFGIDPDTGLWRSTPLEQVGGLLTELAQQTALDLLARMTLTQALSEGLTAVRQAVGAGLRADGRLSGLGIGVEDVRVIALRAERDVEKALQTPARESVQQAADKATYERRAMAVERERSIAENELQNQIELARREEQLVNQRGQNERMRATEAAAAGQIETEAAAGRQRALSQAEADAKRVLGSAEADAKRAMGEAEAATEQAILEAYGRLDAATVLALAIKQAGLPEIGSLNLTPDLITPLMAKLVA
ncbi:SPFH domain-containing protein [Kribbella solani]|uniref:Regulator of protease activity HflC (Stomatin/prohibitin superfamily) n=1 Tax=Kribbella solani TaxID=236067 RepID=A0A841E247_9ACTN|nr:SPFH domain-containing protein [Kribbella solani]MBB5981458.1 regulator of protease activity HflC (stomatin/prohibitin superfamily) [Kribbella solani]MDX2973493.1 SPFH domain-containing protein [Kribbella solani]MDX3005747.1 SPFH domain-containing protein [Kribbella solani]